MGFLDKLFKRKKVNTEKKASYTATPVVRSKEAVRFMAYHEYVTRLMKTDGFISRKSYSAELDSFQDVIQFFSVLNNSGMLEIYSKQNDLDPSMIRSDLAWFSHASELIDKHNENYISEAIVAEADYLDGILHEVDPQIRLDEDQRRVILTDEDYCLVIAGAGAGKTTTVAAKVKYLVERKGLDPKQILVVSFTNKAVQELRDKINKELAIDCPISTFHSVGNAIIHKNSPDEKLNIVDEGRLYFVVRDYFRNSVLKNESVVDKLILFFASYFDAPFEGKDINTFFNNLARSNFSTM